MTDEEKLTLIQKYEDLPEEEFKEECFEDLKKFAFDKDDTVKTFTASVLSRFVNTAKQQEAIEILLQLCREENELIRTEAYDAIGCYCEKSVVKSLEKAVLSEKDGLARSYAIDSWIYVQQHLCTNETEVIGYLNAILEKESNNNCILNCLYGKQGQGYVTKASKAASTYAKYGWGTYKKTIAVKDWKPGDIMSSPTHIYIVVGSCADGSVVLVHSSPAGVRLSGTPDKKGRTNSEAVKLAKKYMKKYYPSWYKRYPSCKKDKSYLTDYAQFRWRAGKGKMISDPDGYQKKNARQVLKDLYSDK